MNNLPLLTKSKFMRALQCPKAVWFDQNRQDLKPGYNSEALFRFETGDQINALAHECFDNGVMVVERGLPNQS